MSRPVQHDDLAEALGVGNLLALEIVDVAALESTGESKVELRIDGDVVSESMARGLHGHFWIPDMPE